MASDLSMSKECREAYRVCEEVVTERAKNFAYAIKLLPPRRRRAVSAIYAFSRACDDAADGEGSTATKQERLDAIQRELKETIEEGPPTPVMRALADASARFAIPPEHFFELLEGVRMDLEIRRYASFDDLYRYCYRVASAVGLACLEVFGYEDPAAHGHAEAMGVAMQLTNILRDIAEDAGRDRIYLPQDELARYGISEKEILEGRMTPAYSDLMAFQVERARGYFEKAMPLLPLLSRTARLCPAALCALYKRLLDKIEAAGYDVFSRRIRLTTKEKLALAKAAVGAP